MKPPIKVLDAELHFLSMAHILVDTLHRIPMLLTPAKTYISLRFLINRARAALKELDHMTITGFEKELKRIGIYLDEVEKYQNERESIQPD